MNTLNKLHISRRLRLALLTMLIVSCAATTALAGGPSKGEAQRAITERRANRLIYEELVVDKGANPKLFAAVEKLVNDGYLKRGKMAEAEDGEWTRKVTEFFPSDKMPAGVRKVMYDRVQNSKGKFKSNKFILIYGMKKEAYTVLSVQADDSKGVASVITQVRSIPSEPLFSFMCKRIKPYDRNACSVGPVREQEFTLRQINGGWRLFQGM